MFKKYKLPVVSTRDVTYNMTTTANTAVQYIGKLREVSSQGGKFFLFSFLLIVSI